MDLLGNCKVNLFLTDDNACIDFQPGLTNFTPEFTLFALLRDDSSIIPKKIVIYARPSVIYEHPCELPTSFSRKKSQCMVSKNFNVDGLVSASLKSNRSAIGFSIIISD